MLSANMGIASGDTAKVMQSFMGMSGATMESAQASTMIAAQMAEVAGVSPQQIFKDMASASATTLTMVRGNVSEMIKLSIEARRYGTSMETITSSARGLLNFQESVNAEMEASVLLGKGFNMQSTSVAFEGDMVGVLKEQRKMLANNDITKMNAFQQESFAKMLGLSVDELVKMDAQRKIEESRIKSMGEAEYERLQLKMQEKETQLSKLKSLKMRWQKYE